MIRTQAEHRRQSGINTLQQIGRVDPARAVAIVRTACGSRERNLSMLQLKPSRESHGFSEAAEASRAALHPSQD
jgi:hypothetical protein